MRLKLVKVHLVTGLDEPTHREKWLVHLHDLEAYDHRGRATELCDDVSALLTNIDNDLTIGSFVFRSHLRISGKLQATSGGTTISGAPL